MIRRRRHTLRGHRAGIGLFAACVGLALALLRLDIGVAAFVTATNNGPNTIAALTVAPPTAVQADLSLNPLGLSCKSTVSWVASATTGVTGYEIVRVVSSTGAVALGPWVATVSPSIDSPVPLQVLGNAYEWRVRSILGTWRSVWVTATSINLALCLL